MKDFRWKIMGRLANNIFQYAYLYSEVRRGNIPDIYLQDPKYFEEYEAELKQILGENIGYSENVAIHVRRGDYVNNPFYVDLMQTSYYQRAIALFPDEKFTVFSDDIEWCMQQPIFSGMHFAMGGTDEDDINGIASCKSQIISNSSFGWWGAFLSPHDGTVVAPKEWYTDGIERTKLPLTWVRI